MTPDIDPEILLLYVAGAADADEIAFIEAKLCSGCPTTNGAYVEALAVFHAMPLGLTCIDPPASVRHAILGRVTVDCSKINSAGGLAGDSQSYATRFRWPVYVSSGLAACLAVGLTISVWNNRQLESRNAELAIDSQQLSERVSQMSATLTTGRQVLSSPHVSLARMKTMADAGKPDKTFGRVLFCPVTRQYQVTVYGLAPLPPNKAYELWLITPDGRKVPAGTFVVNTDGTATVTAHASEPVDVAANAAITDEPAAGSAQPTGSIQLIAALQPAGN
ncbi:MAG: putative anti-sigma factor [Phycisphaerales bacterium]|nr:putative anti-sigma factor [Phycisphaerales bacterium]